MQRRVFQILAGVALAATAQAADRLPASLAGSWRIAHILPTQNAACWDAERAKTLLGTTLTYRPTAMRWQGGEVPLDGIVTRVVTAEVFASENADSRLTLADLKIQSASVTEVDLQHEDMDITGSTTEVPGDSVLIASPSRIVVSACGVYYEATRVAARGVR